MRSVGVNMGSECVHVECYLTCLDSQTSHGPLLRPQKEVGGKQNRISFHLISQGMDKEISRAPGSQPLCQPGSLRCHAFGSYW